MSESTPETRTLRQRLSDRLLARVRKVSPRMRVINRLAMAVAVVVAVATIWVMGEVLRAYERSDEANRSYEMSQEAAQALLSKSDYLTSQARLYVTVDDSIYLENYIAELSVRDGRGVALEVLREHAKNEEAVEALESARSLSDQLAEVELRALRLAAESRNLKNMPRYLARIELEESDRMLSDAQKGELAHSIMYGDEYLHTKLAIREEVQNCSDVLVNTLRYDVEVANERLENLMRLMRVGVIDLAGTLVVLIALFNSLLLWPMALHERSIRNDEALIPSGARELRYLTDAYNDMFERNHTKTESLTYEARNDALTGLLNRGAYEELLTKHKSTSALILVDVDLFKRFNDDFGHEMGDAVLIEVAATLFGYFRSTDFVCRIGGDEFAVIMTNADESLRHVIEKKIEDVATFLRDTSNGLPRVTISVGVAFGNYGMGEDELFKKADTALYETKRNGRDGYTFYREKMSA